MNVVKLDACLVLQVLETPTVCLRCTVYAVAPSTGSQVNWTVPPPLGFESETP